MKNAWQPPALLVMGGLFWLASYSKNARLENISGTETGLVAQHPLFWVFVITILVLACASTYYCQKNVGLARSAKLSICFFLITPLVAGVAAAYGVSSTLDPYLEFLAQFIGVGFVLFTIFNLIGERSKRKNSKAVNTLVGGRPAQQKATIEQTNACIAQSRRYERPLTMVTLRLSQALEANAVLREVSAKNLYAAKEIVKGWMRETDLYLEGVSDNDCAILCPETDASQISHLANRLKRLCVSVDVDIDYAIACFPDDGYFVVDLMKSCMDRLASPETLHIAQNENRRAG